MPYSKNAISSKNEDMLMENEYYKKYYEQKQKIKERYPQDLWERPNGSKNALNKNYNNHHLWKQYIKEICDLMHEKEGWYQKFIWDTYSDSDKALMEQKARGNQKGNRLTDFNYY